MPEIKLENVTKRWGKFYGVDHLNLNIENNSFITLLGPLRMRKDHHPENDRRPGNSYIGKDFHRRQSGI